MLIRDRGFYKSFFSLFGVLVLQNVIAFSVNLADNIMIGGYSEAALSGVAAVNQIQFWFQQLTMSAAEAVVVLSSQYWGQKRTAPIKTITGAALILAFSIGFLLFLVTSIYPNEVIGLFTPSEKIIFEGVNYLKIIRFTYIIFALTSVLLAMLRSVETVKIAFYVSLSTLIINCCINYVLINGHFGAPQMGVRGAAIGTLTARITEFLIIVCYLAFADKRLNVRIKDFFCGAKQLYADYFKNCVSFIVTGLIFGTSTALQTVILGHMNDSAIAANSVATTLYQLLKVATIGAASAASVHIGMAVGKGDMNYVKSMAKTLQVIFLCIGILTSITLLILKTPVLGLYKLSSETKAMASSFISVLCVTCIGTGYQMPVACGIIRGGGDAKFILINDLISLWLIVIPISFAAAFVWKWSSVAVVTCLNSDQVFKCLAVGIKANRYKWIKKLTRE